MSPVHDVWQRAPLPITSITSFARCSTSRRSLGGIRIVSQARAGAGASRVLSGVVGVAVRAACCVLLDVCVCCGALAVRCCVCWLSPRAVVLVSPHGLLWRCVGACVTRSRGLWTRAAPRRWPRTPPRVSPPRVRPWTPARMAPDTRAGGPGRPRGWSRTPAQAGKVRTETCPNLISP